MHPEGVRSGAGLQVSVRVRPIEYQAEPSAAADPVCLTVVTFEVRVVRTDRTPVRFAQQTPMILTADSLR